MRITVHVMERPGVAVVLPEGWTWVDVREAALQAMEAIDDLKFGQGSLLPRTGKNGPIEVAVKDEPNGEEGWEWGAARALLLRVVDAIYGHLNNDAALVKSTGLRLVDPRVEEVADE